MSIDFLTDEDIQFLQSLAHELKTQDRSCTAKPVYFTIREKETVFGFDPDYSDSICLLIGDDYETFLNLDEAIKHLKEYYEFTESELVDLEDLESVSEFLEGRGINCTLTGYKNQYNHSGAFLTRAGANQHIEINGHNLDKPIAYCHHVFRNRELERLLQIVEKFESQVAADD